MKLANGKWQMAKLRAMVVAVSLLTSSPTWSATVVIPLQNFRGVPNNHPVMIHMRDQPEGLGTNLVFGADIQGKPTNGVVRVDLVPGNYDLLLEGINRPLPFPVPTNAGTFNILTLLTNGVSAALSDPPRVFQLLAGTGINLSPTNGKGVVTVSRSGAAGLTNGSSPTFNNLTTTGSVTATTISFNNLYGGVAEFNGTAYGGNSALFHGLWFESGGNYGSDGVGNVTVNSLHADGTSVLNGLYFEPTATYGSDAGGNMRVNTIVADALSVFNGGLNVSGDVAVGGDVGVTALNANIIGVTDEAVFTGSAISGRSAMFNGLWFEAGDIYGADPSGNVRALSVIANSYGGDGSGLTNLDATKLTGGPVTNPIATGAATISGNGSGLTNLTAANLVGGPITNAITSRGTITTTNGFASYSTNRTLVVATGGITNTLGVNLQVLGFTGTTVSWKDNAGTATSLGTITSPQTIVLQPGGALSGSSCAASGTHSF